MNTEFLTVLEHLEREKGVSRAVLLEAVQSALVSAARKVVPDKESEIEVKIDPETGDIAVLCAGKKIKSGEFGRIAAQTAKQVIIQKIREAEREAVYDEFHTRVNALLTGTVYRYEKGAVILDVGKTEAILPKREQSPRDSFRQGDRARVYVLEVSRQAKGPQILVSRSHPGLVKKLFEIEVPEVLEGIVELKAVARDPGDRSKIAVWSKDEKVDCVGACVGMRGLRVKNIVRELQGEKIDIVRWSEDIVEYVKGALSPAQCDQITIKDREAKTIDVLVDDDQLSLAIGKNGQNVRLAVKLTGWSIDIRSKKEAAKALLEGAGSAEPAAAAEEDLTELEGVGPKVAEALKRSGLTSVAQVAGLELADLVKVEGVGEKTAQKILNAAKARAAQAPEAAEPEAPPASEEAPAEASAPAVSEEKPEEKPEEKKETASEETIPAAEKPAIDTPDGDSSAEKAKEGHDEEEGSQSKGA